MGKKYYAEDLQIDINWMKGLYEYGIDEKSARDFIYYLLNKTPSSEVKALRIEEKL